MRCGTARAADPLANLGGDFRQALGPENEQTDDEYENELRETDIEHGIASSLGATGLVFLFGELRVRLAALEASGRFFLPRPVLVRLH